MCREYELGAAMCCLEGKDVLFVVDGKSAKSCKKNEAKGSDESNLGEPNVIALSGCSSSCIS